MDRRASSRRTDSSFEAGYDGGRILTQPEKRIMTRPRTFHRLLIVLHPAESAKAAGLRYTTDAKPGIRRMRRGRAFVYVDPDGRRAARRRGARSASSRW